MDKTEHFGIARYMRSILFLLLSSVNQAALEWFIQQKMAKLLLIRGPLLLVKANLLLHIKSELFQLTCYSQ